MRSFAVLTICFPASFLLLTAENGHWKTGSICVIFDTYVHMCHMCYTRMSYETVVNHVKCMCQMCYIIMSYVAVVNHVKCMSQKYESNVMLRS